jgi:catalase (peroxidase I)
MPKGPNGENRPADVIGAAVKVMKIATGEEADDREDDSLLTAAAQLGKLGGAARARSLTPEQRTNIARKAAAKRWSDK